MNGWREVAARALAVEAGPEEAPSLSDLPVAVLQGLDALGKLPPPRKLHDPAAWGVVVADALHLQESGWAERAVQMGWHPLELFGIGRRNSNDFAGLAAWLQRRRLILLSEQSATVADGEWRRVFNRARDFSDLHAQGAIVWLWEFGR